MPHQCVKCNALYADDAPETMHGCVCGAKAFLFLKNGASDATNDARDARHHGTHGAPLTAVPVPEHVRDIVLDAGKSHHAAGRGAMILNAESIVLREDGKYDIDLNALLESKAIVYRHEDGKYTIDLEESFRRRLSRR